MAISGSNITGLLARDVSKATPDQIKQLASFVSTWGGASANGLVSAFNDMALKDQKGRDAAVFALSQNPAYRQLIESKIPGFFKYNPSPTPSPDSNNQ